MTEVIGKTDKSKSEEEYNQLVSQATPLGLVRDLANLRAKNLNGWAIRVFPEHDRPELLVLFSEGFVERAIRWESPVPSPLFDLCFRSGFIELGTIPDELSKIRHETLDGVCRKWHPSGFLGMKWKID